MSKVLIIGCGGVASVAIHKCCQVPEVFTEICIASRTKSKCDQFVEWFLNLKRNIYDHQKETHTYQDQADCKNPTQFLTDCTEYKVILDNRDLLRRTLTQSHSKPSACSNGKQ